MHTSLHFRLGVRRNWMVCAMNAQPYIAGADDFPSTCAWFAGSSVGGCGGLLLMLHAQLLI